MAAPVAAPPVPAGLLSYGHHPTTGKLVSFGGPYRVNLGLAYDGSLMTDVIWSGEVAGTVHRDHDNDFRIANELAPSPYAGRNGKKSARKPASEQIDGGSEKNQKPSEPAAEREGTNAANETRPQQPARDTDHETQYC